jgi:hypothetical protein
MSEPRYDQAGTVFNVFVESPSGRRKPANETPFRSARYEVSRSRSEALAAIVKPCKQPGATSKPSRALCERQLRAAGACTGTLSDEVDRYWHCVAAGIEAGLIDEQGNRLRAFDFDRGSRSLSRLALSAPDLSSPRIVWISSRHACLIQRYTSAPGPA